MEVWEALPHLNTSHCTQFTEMAPRGRIRRLWFTASYS